MLLPQYILSTEERTEGRARRSRREQGTNPKAGRDRAVERTVFYV
jgi:hypothetical protein